MSLLTLDDNGIALAFVMGFIMLLIGANSVGGLPLGIFYVVAMLYFLALSAVVTWTGRSYKRHIKQYQKARGVKNVLANGMGPLLFVALVCLVGHGIYLIAGGVGFIASVAAVTSDKFSSEIGIMAGKPTSIVTFKKIKKGESGGVTPTGLFAGLFGSFMISLVLCIGFLIWFLPYFSSSVGSGTAVLTVIIATLSGFVGTLVDSVAGHWEEKGFGNKYTSNFICSMAGGILGVLLCLIIL